MLLPATLTHALERGATVLTASAEQARAIHTAWGITQRRAGRRSWPTPDVLSAQAWVTRCWSQAIAVDASGTLPQIPSVTQDHALWERVVLADAGARSLLQPFGAVRAARRAWQRLQDWNIRLPHEREGASDETATFSRWARDYNEELERKGWLDAARAPWRWDQLEGVRLPGEVVFAGFDTRAPAHRYLGERLAARGVQVAWPATSAEVSSGVQLALPDAQSELEAAAQWALGELQARPDSQLLIVIPDLEQQRKQVERLFTRTLSPASALIQSDRRPVPFVIEGGSPVGDSPLVAAALTALELASGALPFEIASDWLRTPFLGGGLEAIARRARIDAQWRRVAPPEVTLWHVVRALKGRVDGDAADTDLAHALERLAETLRRPRSTPSDWSGTFALALRELGWPGTQALDEAELGALQAFKDALAELATLDGIAGAVTLDSALRSLAGLISRSRLAQRSRASGIAISGRLADPCVRYDGIWVTGLHAAAWPGPSRPDPFIAQPLQIAAGVPEATAVGTLELTRRITRSILGAAPRVVVSWPRHLADADAEPSPLLASLPTITAAEIQYGGPSYLQRVFHSRSLETLHDEQAPPLPTPAQLRGGATALQLQSNCPFRAFAQRRLRAERLERPVPGVDPRVRGSFIHRALDSLWTELRDHAVLLRQSNEERRALIEAVIAKARAEVFGRSDRWPVLLIDLECARLDALLRRWLEVESLRPPFRVLGVEQHQQWSEAGLTFTLRIDRIDQLADGRTLLLDYKTGEANANRWQGDRPEEPQMLLYATALEPAPGAVSFGLLNAEACGFDGLSSLPPALPELEAVAEWGAQLASWRKVLQRLARRVCRRRCSRRSAESTDLRALPFARALQDR